MMFKELFNASQDERSVIVTGRCATVFLGITQILLLLTLLRHRYLLDQPASEIWDIQAVLLLSIFGYICARLYLGGALPALVGPAILIGLYSLTAHLGKRRIERMMKAED